MDRPHRPRPRRAWRYLDSPPEVLRMSIKFLLAAGVSAIILATLYLTIDVSHVITTLADTDPTRLLISVAVLLGLIGLSGIRLAWLARTAGVNVGYVMALKATLAANALNLFMPG